MGERSELSSTSTWMPWALPPPRVDEVYFFSPTAITLAVLLEPEAFVSISTNSGETKS
jgi:hypothetical protein